MVRKLDPLELTLVDRNRIELAIMTERHVESARSVPFRPHRPSGLDESWETLLSWHRKLVAQKYDGSSRRSPGRPQTGAEIEALVVRMAGENRDWGYGRIEGALSNLGHKLGRRMVKKSVLIENTRDLG